MMTSSRGRLLPPVLLLLLLLLPLASHQQQLAAPSKTYWCDQASRQTRIADPQPAEFSLVTSYPGSAYASPSMRCQFLVEAPLDGSLYHLEVAANPAIAPRKGSGSGLTVRDAVTRRVLAATSSGGERRVPSEHTVLVTRRGDALLVTFETSSSLASGQQPATLRLRRFVNCPPGWMARSGYCFTRQQQQQQAVGNDTQPLRQLDFATSQAACNSMRSNLLMMSFPAASAAGQRDLGNYSLVDFFTGVLRYSSDAWVGLTDTSGKHYSWGGFFLRWLDGSWFKDHLWPDDLRCASSPGWPSSRCRDDERCAFVSARGSASNLVLDRCRRSPASRRFACYMPANGTDTFYRVPDYSASGLLAWLLPTAICGFFFGLAALALVSRRLRRRRRQLLVQGASGCSGSGGYGTATVVPPPPFGYDSYGRPAAWYQPPPPPPGVGHVQQHQCPQPPPYCREPQCDSSKK